MNVEELDVVLLSLRVSLAVVLVSLVPGILLGWLLARWTSRCCLVLHGLVMLPLVLPPVVTGYALLRLFGRSQPLGVFWHQVTGTHLAYTTTACVVAAATVGFPLLVESVRQSIKGVDPRLELVARSLGRGRLSTFVRVTLPLAVPGVLAGSVLAFARALGEFGATIVFAGNIAGETCQIPLAVHTLMNTPGGEAAVVRLSLVSVGLAFLALMAAGAFAGFGSRRRGAP